MILMWRGIAVCWKVLNFGLISGKGDFWKLKFLMKLGNIISWNEGTNNTVLEVEAEVTNNHQFHNSSDL